MRANFRLTSEKGSYLLAIMTGTFHVKRFRHVSSGERNANVDFSS